MGGTKTAPPSMCVLDNLWASIPLKSPTHYTLLRTVLPNSALGNKEADAKSALDQKVLSCPPSVNCLSLT